MGCAFVGRVCSKIACPDSGSGLVLSLSGMKGNTLRDPYLRRSSKVSFVSRESIPFGFSWLVTGLVTVNGNNEDRRNYFF